MELTGELMTLIAEAVSAGADRETAAMSCGVQRSLYQRWAAAGARGESPYVEWLHQLDVAEAEAEVVRLKALAGTKDSRVHQWVLERLNAERWGTKIQIDVTRQFTEFLTCAEEVLPPALFDSLLEAYDRRVGGAAADAAGHGSDAPGGAPGEPPRLH